MGANSNFLPEVKADEARKSKDRISRLKRYVRWLDATGRLWSGPDLKAYRGYLMHELKLKPETAENYLNPVRARYRELLTSGEASQRLQQAGLPFFEMVPALEAMQMAGDIEQTRIPVERPSIERLSLSPGDVETLLNAPGVKTLRGLRDTAIIALMAFTGLRPAEVGALTAESIDYCEGQLIVHVPDGAGCQARDIEWFVGQVFYEIVKVWQEAAEITKGPLFTGFFRGRGRRRSTGLTPNGVEKILQKYPIQIASDEVVIKPFDLRRFYARMLYALEVDLSLIQLNLGHTDTATTLEYVGNLSGFERLDYPLPYFDFSQLGIYF